MTQVPSLTVDHSFINQSPQPKLWQILRLLKSCLSVMVTENSLKPVIEMSDMLIDMPAQEEAAAYLKQGELGLLAFHLPQFPYPLSVGVIASSILSSMIWEPRWMPAIIEAIAQSFAMGKVAKPLVAQRWEEEWDKPLSQWRDELNIQPLV